jgi:hypothetical protein
MGATADRFGKSHFLKRNSSGLPEPCPGTSCNHHMTLYLFDGFPICNDCCFEQTGHGADYWELNYGLPFSLVGRPAGAWALAVGAHVLGQQNQQQITSTAQATPQTTPTFKIGDTVEVYGHQSNWDGTIGTISKIGSSLIQIIILSTNARYYGKGAIASFNPTYVKLVNNTVSKTSISDPPTQPIKIGDRVQVIGSDDPDWNRVKGIVIDIDSLGQIYFTIEESSIPGFPKGSDAKFPSHRLKLLGNTKSSKLKLKSCGHTVRIIETKEDKVRFLIVESKTESDWYLKSEFDKETVEIIE